MSRSMEAPPVSQELSFLWLEITAKCNLECVHCYADSGPGQHLFGEMTIDKWFAVLADAAALGCRQVQFIGGEPTLHPDLPRMISFARSQGYEFIEVYTNATHIDDQLLKLFVRHGVHLAISFYSDNPAIHDAITKRRGSFLRTVGNIRRLILADLPVRAGIIEMRENLGRGKDAMQFLERLGVSDIKIDFQRGIGRAAKSAAPDDLMGELCGECWKGKLCVTSSGKAYPCVFSRFAEVGTAAGGVAKILGDHRLQDFRERLQTQYRVKANNMETESTADCDPKCSPCQPVDFEECRPKGGFQRAALGPDMSRLHDSDGGDRKSVHEDMRGCDPTCSPCEPTVFKCAPGRSCSPKSGPSSAAVRACTPQCSPSCSPCPPGEFRCAPPSLGLAPSRRAQEGDVAG